MACIKQVFGDKQETAHVWAKQEQYEGREGSSVQRIFFEGPTIFSYGRHFPIATFHQKKGQEKVVIFTNRTYSHTTSAHIWAVRSASSQFKHIYCFNPQEAVAGRHDENMKKWEIKAEIIALKLSKAKKPEIYLSGISSLRREMEAYAEYFHCGIKKYKFRYLFIESQDTGKKLTAKARAEESEYNKTVKERRDKYESEQAKREAARIEREILAFRKMECDFVNGSEFTFLRFNNGKIETSKRINIDLQDAKEYYVRLKYIQEKCKERQEFNLFGTASEGMTFEGYPMRSAGPEYFEIGCHKIKFSELDAVAKVAGLTMQEMKEV